MRPYECLAIDSNTLAYWRFGERLTLADQSGHGLDVTLGGSGAIITPDGLDVSAANGYAQAALNLSAVADLTVEGWFRYLSTDDNPADITTLFQWAVALTDAIRVYTVAGTDYLKLALRVEAQDVAYALTYQLTAAQLAAFRAEGGAHIAATVDRDGLGGHTHKLWFNGVQIITYTNSLPAWTDAAGTMYLGRGLGYFVGIIDEVRISDVVRYSAAFAPRRHSDGRRALVRGPLTADAPGVLA